MKNTLKKYHLKTEEELKALLTSDDSIFVFDTCVLLDFFRCSENTRNELQKIFEECQDRLYMPYQVGKEFYKNRHNIVPGIDEQIKQLINKLHSTANEIKSKFSKGTYFLASLSNSVHSSILRLVKSTTEKQKKFHSTIKEDEICCFFERIFNEKVGSKRIFTVEQMTEFNKRVENGTPPGEKDKENKDIPYGDYIIWLDIIQKAKDAEKNIIFITSETKTDWFYKGKSDRIIAPRAELLEEFDKETNKVLHIYNIATFVEDWHKLAKLDKVPTKVIAELHKMFNLKEQNNSETASKRQTNLEAVQSENSDSTTK